MALPSGAAACGSVVKERRRDIRKPAETQPGYVRPDKIFLHSILSVKATRRHDNQERQGGATTRSDKKQNFAQKTYRAVGRPPPAPFRCRRSAFLLKWGIRAGLDVVAQLSCASSP